MLRLDSGIFGATCCLEVGAAAGGPAGFDSLILTKPGFLKELPRKVNKAKTKPTVSQNHLAHNAHRHSKHHMS